MNRVDLIGRLTRDPELRRASTGNAMVRFTIAVDRRNRGQAQPGQQTADFIGCVAFGKTAENMARFLHKGSLVSIEGRIQTGSYVNQQGQKVYTTDVIADSVQFLEPRNAQSQGYVSDSAGGYYDGGYDNGGYGGGYSNAYSGQSAGGFGGYGNPNPGPYAKSSDNGFGQPARPAGSGFGQSAPDNGAGGSSDFIDRSKTLDLGSDDGFGADDNDISSDDLPF